MRSRHGVVVVKCGECKAPFVEQEQLDAHMREHDEGNEPRKHACGNCAQTFATAARLGAHVAHCELEA